MPRIFFVAGLGFGDEGKGSIVDAIVHKEKATTVVRYNGGSQAAHNVVTDLDTHHTFSQFGSGTFHGAKTYLSKHVLIDLPALYREGMSLAEKGVNKPFELMHIDEDALLITPYQKAANRIEELRRMNRHGSCGMGIGVTRKDSLDYPDSVPRVKDIYDPKKLQEKLSFIKETKLMQFVGVHLTEDKYADSVKLLTTPVERVAEQFLIAKTMVRITNQHQLREILQKEIAVFEGAQGVLLDENFGFQPHTTWTDTTFKNAFEILESVGGNYLLSKVGVIRSYMTRHGAGPLPTEDTTLLPLLQDPHNTWGPWQGNMRYGYPDMVLLKYALGIMAGGHDIDWRTAISHLAVTHKDKEDKIDKICVSYKRHDSLPSHLFRSPSDITISKLSPSYNVQEQLGNILDKVEPVYWPNTGLNDFIYDYTKMKVSIESYGPSIKNKRWL